MGPTMLAKWSYWIALNIDSTRMIGGFMEALAINTIKPLSRDAALLGYLHLAAIGLRHGLAPESSDYFVRGAKPVEQFKEFEAVAPLWPPHIPIAARIEYLRRLHGVQNPQESWQRYHTFFSLGEHFAGRGVESHAAFLVSYTSFLWRAQREVAKALGEFALQEMPTPENPEFGPIRTLDDYEDLMATNADLVEEVTAALHGPVVCMDKQDPDYLRRVVFPTPVPFLVKK